MALINPGDIVTVIPGDPANLKQGTLYIGIALNLNKISPLFLELSNIEDKYLALTLRSIVLLKFCMVNRYLFALKYPIVGMDTL